MTLTFLSRIVSGRWLRWRHLPYIFLVLLLGSGGMVRAQEQPPGAGQATSPTSGSAQEATQPSKAPASDNATAKSSAPNAEISQVDSQATFKVRVNLVQVRVVVRDPSGKPVDNLKREDFLLYDQGKLQTISNFSRETPQSRQLRAEAIAKTQADAAPSDTAAISLPEHFVALVYDDTHLSLEDTTFVRQQSQRFLDSTSPSDRVGLFTTSGQVTQDFTADREALHKAILGIFPRAQLPHSGGGDCPNISYYQADQIENIHDSQALAVAVEDTVQCLFNGDETKRGQAVPLAEAAAVQALTNGDTESEFTYRHIEDILRRLASMPGQRVMLFVSPGFILSTLYLDETGIIDRANRSNIVINTVDARGLYTPDLLGDISQPNPDSPRTAGFKASYRISEQFGNQFVLQDFAAGTGGTFFHNSNDLETGIKQAGLSPEIYYVLAFSPQTKKMDGRYHQLKVELAAKKTKYSVQARHGYFAPRKIEDPQEQAKQEIQEAIFSQEEIQELPLDLQTQYFKGDAAAARLSVVSRLELKGIHFRKAEGRNIDDLTLATAIFDENGNFVTGGEKIVKMQLLDTTYNRLSRSGLTVKSSFEVKPGRYLVRQVVRDSEGAQMAARNGAVEIPN